MQSNSSGAASAEQQGSALAKLLGLERMHQLADSEGSTESAPAADSAESGSSGSNGGGGGGNGEPTSSGPEDSAIDRRTQLFGDQQEPDGNGAGEAEPPALPPPPPVDIWEERRKEEKTVQLLLLETSHLFALTRFSRTSCLLSSAVEVRDVPGEPAAAHVVPVAARSSCTMSDLTQHIPQL